MTFTILHHLDQRIRDALDGARAAGAALARSAHEVIEVANPEATATAVGTSGRADLIDRQVVHVLLSGAHLARLDGMLSAYGVVLRLLDDAREEEHAAAVGRIEAEATRDAQTYVAENIEKDELPEDYAAGAFASWIADEPEVIAPLSAGEAQAIYLAAFLRSVQS